MHDVHRLARVSCLGSGQRLRLLTASFRTHNRRHDRERYPQADRLKVTPTERIAEKTKGLHAESVQALDLFGARSRNRTGTSFRTGDFKSHASTNFAIRAVAL